MENKINFLYSITRKLKLAAEGAEEAQENEKSIKLPPKVFVFTQELKYVEIVLFFVDNSLISLRYFDLLINFVFFL